MSNVDKPSLTSSQLDRFSSMYKSINIDPQNRDIAFVCGGEKLAYHQAVIFQYSSFLANLATNCANAGDVIVTLDNVNPVILRMLMDCIYSGQCDKVPAEVLYEVEGILKMLGLNLFFSAEAVNGDEEKGESEDNMDEVEKPQTFVCFECNMSFDLDIKLKTHMKKQHGIKREVLNNPEEENINESTDVLNDIPPKESIESPTENLYKTENSLLCTYCDQTTSFTALPQFLQHLSLKHFRKQLKEKYKMVDFFPHKPCMNCQKPQKNVPSYLAHIGVAHNKVFQFLPKVLKEKIRIFNVQKKQQKYSKSGEVNVISIKKEIVDELQETNGMENPLENPLQTDKTKQSQHSGLVIKQEVSETVEPVGEMNALHQQIDSLSENLIPKQSSLKAEVSDSTMNPLNIKQEVVNGNSHSSIISNERMISGMSCTLCENPQEFPSRARLLQHVSLAHFKVQLAQKYLGGFANGQSCDYCKKVQKNKQTYLAHLGAHHEKVLEFIPIEIELQTMIVHQKKKPTNKNFKNNPRKQKLGGKKFRSVNNHQMTVIKKEKLNSEHIETQQNREKSLEMNSSNVKNLFAPFKELLADELEEENKRENIKGSSYKQESKENGGDEKLLDDTMDHTENDLENVLSENILPNEQSNKIDIGSNITPEMSSEISLKSTPNKSPDVNSDLSNDVDSNMSNTEESSSSLDESSPVNSSNFDNSVTSNTTCTICKKPQDLFSRSRLLQHFSGNHFFTPLAKKYLGQFVFGQNCKYCEKVQKTKKAYAIHLGSKHEKVLKFVPIEILSKLKNRGERKKNYSTKHANENNTMESNVPIIPKTKDEPENDAASDQKCTPVSDMKCTVCKNSPSYSSRAKLLQHASIAHFHKPLAQKYLAKFVEGQNCELCPKRQKSRYTYILHLGALHEKVVELIPNEMQTMILNYQKNENKPNQQVSKGKQKKNIENNKLLENLKNEKPSLSDGGAQNKNIQCIMCQPVKGFISKSSFMQHLSVSHFRRQIREKYLQNFHSGQPCDECQKPQKNEMSYIIHIGTLHQKVIDFLPAEMISTICDIRRRRRTSG